MKYERFLTDNDYLALITEEGLEQLIRGRHERLAQAEQRAESVIVDYLDQFYDIHGELAKGKSIRDYSHYVTYPSNAYFKKNGSIYQTLTMINATHKPTDVVYWEEWDIEEECKHIKKYLQLETYKPGDIVLFNNLYYRCLVANGWDFNNIQMPGVEYWREIETSIWVPNMDYPLYSVVSYAGAYYMVISRSENDNMSLSPDINEVFGLIGNYDEGYNYSSKEADHDYVVFNGKVFAPVLNPNADELEFAVNVKEADPRNYNLVNYITSIALYFLHSLVSPTQVPQSRIDMYNQAMEWVIFASKMKLDPHIPRKINRETHEPKDDWAMASFETHAQTQVRNPWFV